MGEGPDNQRGREAIQPAREFGEERVGILSAHIEGILAGFQQLVAHGGIGLGRVADPVQPALEEFVFRQRVE